MKSTWVSLMKNWRQLERKIHKLFKSNPRLLVYLIAAFIGILQFSFVFMYLAEPSPRVGPMKKGDDLMSKSLGNEKVEVKDIWQKYFSHTDQVPWAEFATHLVVSKAWEVRDLPKQLKQPIRDLFDTNNDHKVSTKEFHRGLMKHGELGISSVVEALVNQTLSKAMKQREEMLNPKDTSGCAVGLHGRYRNFLEVPRSQDMQFQGEAEFCIEAWISPNQTSEAHKTYGGTIISKYNRGRMGQFFMNLEHSGDLFFHRETPPWGLRSAGVHIPPGVFTHVAVSYGQGRSKVYINGTLRGSQREGGAAVDDQTPLLLGAIHDNGLPTSGFHGLLEEVRLWNVDRTQVEIQTTMHTTLTGAEFGLLAYWSFDECAGGQVRDKVGRHDGELHGGRWHSSPVTLYKVEDYQQLADEAADQDLKDMAAKGEKLNFNYWKRSINVLEEQIRLNRLILKRKAEFKDLVRRIKVLEKNDQKLGTKVGDINQRNVNITTSVSDMSRSLYLHENMTGVYGMEYPLDTGAGGMFMEELMMDDNILVQAWETRFTSDIPSLPQDDWKSFEEMEEERLEMEDDVQMDLLPREEQEEVRARRKKRMEMLPAIELAVKSGFEAEEHSLDVLKDFNKGTFQMDKEISEESEEAEYVELLKMKGYSTSRIKALLRRRHEARAQGRDMSLDRLPIAQLLIRHANNTAKDSLIKGKKKKKSGEAALSDLVPKKKKKKKSIKTDEEDEEDNVPAIISSEGKKKTLRPIVIPEDEDDYNYVEVTEADQDAQDEYEDTFTRVYGQKKKGKSGKGSSLEEETESSAGEGGVGSGRAKRKKGSKGSSGRPGTKSKKPSSEDLLVDTLVAGLVPKVEQMLRGDDPEDLSLEDEFEVVEEENSLEKDEEEEDEDFKSEMPEELREEMEREIEGLRGGKRKQRKRGKSKDKDMDESAVERDDREAIFKKTTGKTGSKLKGKPNGRITAKTGNVAVEGAMSNLVYNKPKAKKVMPNLWLSGRMEQAN